MWLQLLLLLLMVAVLLLLLLVLHDKSDFPRECLAIGVEKLVWLLRHAPAKRFNVLLAGHLGSESVRPV